MASIRELKKDIDYLVFEVVSDSLTYAGISQENDSEEISAIIEDAVDLRNSLFARISNRPSSDDAAEVKSYYRSVRKDLFEGVDRLFTRLSDLPKGE